MSVEATGWAFRQKVPPKPKMVLMALADQTDETTGRVCYGKADMGHLAVKASVPERSLYRYINALVRNGYVIRESGKEKGKPNLYWLCLDRPVAENIDEWEWAVDASDQDVVEGSAMVADPPDVENETEGLPPNGRGGLPYVADQESLEEHKNIVTRARESAASGFSRKAQDVERENLAISKAASTQGARVFVIDGTRAWDAWVAHRRKSGQIPSMPTCLGSGEYANRRGWWLPSLFPPPIESGQSNKDPPEPNLSENDIRALTGE